jgi:hypothetical protein
MRVSNFSLGTSKSIGNKSTYMDSVNLTGEHQNKNGTEINKIQD